MADGHVGDPITSPSAFYSMGILTTAEWADASQSSGLFIGTAGSMPTATCPWFRKSFSLPGNVGADTVLLHLVS